MSNLRNLSISQNRNRINGLLDTNYENKALELFRIHKTLKAQHLADEFGLSREHCQRTIIKALIKSDKIKPVAGSKGFYQLSESQIQKSDMTKELYSESEIFATELYKNWEKKNLAKNEIERKTRFANICLGLVNPKFKINPDSITVNNWKEIVPNIVDAVLEVATYKITNNEPSGNNRQAIRHAIKYGLGIEISKAEGKELRISGDKQKPKKAELEITKEQTILFKIESKKQSLKEFSKDGFKIWTGCRPSSLYIVETNDLIFYYRTVHYIEVNGEKFFKDGEIRLAKLLSATSPQMQKIIEFKSYTHRACKIPKLHEHKQDEDFKKYIWDEEFVLALERYHKQRTFQKKKYLFWEDNKTEFTFGNYDTIVRSEVTRDNERLKEILLKIGFKKEDFGFYFSANYGMRHFSIQSWLNSMNYNYDVVGRMFHQSSETTKIWYGAMNDEHAEKEMNQVVNV